MATAYVFEGVVTSSVECDKIVFRIKPTAQYQVTNPKNRDLQYCLAFPDSGVGVPLVLQADKLEIKYPPVAGKNIKQEVYAWLNAHADSEKKVSFTTDKKGEIAVFKGK